MKTLMRALFVTAMALTLFYGAGAGVSYAALSGPAYDDFINGIPADNGHQTPDVMGSWE
jgi:hypothetical protein